MTDKLWLLPFGPDQIHLPTLHSPDSGATHTHTLMESKRFPKNWIRLWRFVVFRDCDTARHPSWLVYREIVQSLQRGIVRR